MIEQIFSWAKTLLKQQNYYKRYSFHIQISQKHKFRHIVKIYYTLYEIVVILYKIGEKHN